MAIWLASTPADHLSTAELKNSARLFHRIECLRPFCSSHPPGMARRYPSSRPVVPAAGRQHAIRRGRTFSKGAGHVA